jgi:chromosome segregation ATPase
MNKKIDSPLTEAANSIEQELSQFEKLLQELSRPITTEKALQRAGVSLEECTSSEERLASHLTAFGEAIQGIQARQQRCMEVLNERAAQVHSRHLDRAALVERMASLGKSTSEIIQPIASLEEAAWTAVTPELLASVGEVSARLEEAIADAGDIASAARASDWSDLARDADALKQQLQSVRNQVLLGQRKLASRAPS